MKKLIIALSICLALLLGLCVVLHIREAQGQAGLSRPEETEGVHTYTIRFEITGVLGREQKVTEGQKPEVMTLETEGLRFASWVDAQGNAVDPFAAAVNGDVTYYAVVYPQLVSHTAYLFTDDAGNLRPDDMLTADELHQALHALAAEGAENYFPELPTGSEGVTYSLLNGILTELFESDAVTAAVAGEAEDQVTRAAFAQIMNMLLAWDETETVIIAPGASIPTDVTADRTDAAVLLEASVLHEATEESNQRWGDVELPVFYDPGFVNLDGWLYCVNDDHYFIRDEYVGDLYFGPDGRYTSGDAELDATVASLLNTMLTENPDEDRLGILRVAYDHCHQQYTYRRSYDHPAFGETGWEIERAKAMFETGKGNCYSYAAIFWALARGLGYEARAISGTCLSDEQPHSWCIIELDGEDYFFDPEWQYAYTEREIYDKDMFMIPMNKVSYWTYKWTEDGKEAD